MAVCSGVFSMLTLRPSPSLSTKLGNLLKFNLQKLLLFLLIVYPLSVRAQKNDELFDLPLTQLVNVEVQTASRFKQKSSEAPSAVEVVTGEDIRSFGWRTLADALTAMRGLYVRDDRNYTYLGVRGFGRTADYTSRVLIMVNGRRMNDAVFDQGFTSEEFMLDTNIIDRIEYIPGSGSSVHPRGPRRGHRHRRSVRRDPEGRRARRRRPDRDGHARPWRRRPADVRIHGRARHPRRTRAGAGRARPGARPARRGTRHGVAVDRPRRGLGGARRDGHARGGRRR